MKLYYIARACNLYLICGPFLTEAQAKKALENYNGSLWGDCIIVSREK